MFVEVPIDLLKMSLKLSRKKFFDCQGDNVKITKRTFFNFEVEFIFNVENVPSTFIFLVFNFLFLFSFSFVFFASFSPSFYLFSLFSLFP